MLRKQMIAKTETMTNGYIRQSIDENIGFTEISGIIQEKCYHFKYDFYESMNRFLTDWGLFNR